MGTSPSMPKGWGQAFGARLRIAIDAQGWPDVRTFATAVDADAGSGLRNHIRKILGGWCVPTTFTLASMVRRLPDVNVRWLLTGQPKGDPAMRPEKEEGE